MNFMLETALVLYYTKENRNGFHALVGALETQENWADEKIYFLETEEKLLEELPQIEKKYRQVVLAISFTTVQLWDRAALMKKIQSIPFAHPVYKIAGGPHPTGDPAGTLRLGFDLVALGEGEETFLEILQKIEEGEDPRTVAGIAFQNDKAEMVFTKARSLVDLDLYPPLPLKHGKFGAIEISRGCPFACNYCQTTHLFGHSMRHRSVEKICEAVQRMIPGGFDVLRFITPNAFAYGNSPKDLERLLRSLREIFPPEGEIFVGTFPSEVRPESVTQETLGLVLEYADNDNLTIGAQSGSERMLSVCHRGHSVKDIYQAVELTRKAGLAANVDFIFGLPEETHEDVLATIQVMEDLVALGARIHAHTFLPLPQTPWAKITNVRLSKTLRQKMDLLISKGTLFGNWAAQQKLSTKIARYFATGKIE